MRGLISAFAATTVFFSAGCGLFSEDPTLEISMDRDIYPRGTTMNITAKNVSPEVIYYNSCMPMVLEELSNGSVEEETYLPQCDCFCVTQLRPNERWEGGLDVDWFWANEGMFEPAIGPRHRFRLAFYRDSKLQHLIRPDDLVSDSFRFQDGELHGGD